MFRTFGFVFVAALLGVLIGATAAAKDPVTVSGPAVCTGVKDAGDMQNSLNENIAAGRSHVVMGLSGTGSPVLCAW